MRPLAVVILLLAGLQAFPCINMIERVPGVSQEHVEFYYIGGVEVDVDSVKAFIHFNAERCARGRSRDCNGVVIAHLFLKQFEAALLISTEMVSRSPKDYTTVITHAAALELNGKVAEAIPFMEQAIALNPKSHKGSEWIHLNILRQRLKGGTEISPWALIGTDLRPDGTLTQPDTLDVKALVKQVHYQVNDRMFFTPKHDPLFGALVFAYADLLHLNGYRNQAKREYERAAEYGFNHAWTKPASPVAAVEPNTALELPSISAAPPPKPAKERDLAAEWAAGLFIGLVVLLVIGFVWKNSRTDR